MIKFNNSDIIDWNFDDSNIIKVYHNGAVCYYKIKSEEPPTPTGSTCYEVINDPITAYTATTYDSVYSFADSKWYMKNNLNQYEEYGIYDTATTLSDLTYYEGKLAAVGTTEYQYSGGTWVSVGTYVTTEVTYDIPSGYSTTYQGQTIPTTFKISVADMNVLGTRYINIYDNTYHSFYLQIGKRGYLYYGAPRITGTVTSDSDYYYFTLTDAKPSIEIYRTRGYNGTVHIITEQSTPSVLYQEKDMPLAKAYQSVAAMESETCPTVGVGQYGVVGSDVYQFDSTELWVTVGNHFKVMERSANAANVVGCNSSSQLTTGDTKPSYFDYSGITEAVIGDCTTSIGTNAFNGCTSLSSITIPDSVTSIGNYAFNGCTSLPVENNIRYADTYVIETVDKTLTTYTIKSNSRFINNNIFSGCTALTSATIPDSVTSIGTNAFNGCTSLSSITIPDSVTSIGNYAFNGCTSLSSATIPSGITSIGICFFNGCTGLTSVNIPTGVTSIGASAFTRCVVFRENLDLPNATSIGSYAFQQCAITNLNMPNVTSIGSYAFAYCSDLQSINMPNVTSIGSYAFYYFDAFHSIVIPSGVTIINYATFSNSELIDITLPETITSIGGAAFWGISTLRLVIYATTPPTLGTDVFKYVNRLTISVPSSSVNTYKSASGWSTYASSIQAIPNS